MSSITDQAQRQQALDPQQSFAVAAPAGSGKTGLLTQRVLTLLATVDSPEEILCLTFTRKAAGEMQHRILEALTLATGPAPKEPYLQQTWQLGRAVLQRDAEKNWQLNRSPSRLRITTIDSFCRNLALQLGPDSGLSDSVETLELPDHLYLQAISEVLKSGIERQDILGDAIRTLLNHQQNNLNKLVELLQSLLAKRDQWLQHIYQSRGAREQLETYLQETIVSATHKAAAALAVVEGSLCELADYAATNLADDLPDVIPETELEKQPLLACKGICGFPNSDQGFDLAIRHWQGLAHLLLTKASPAEWRKLTGVNKRIGFPTAKDDPELGAVRKQQFGELLEWCQQQPGLLETLEDLRYLPSPHYPDNQWQVLEALTTVLPVLTAQLQLVFQEHNQCDYSEVALAANRALGSHEQPTDIALRLDYQIRHILVDEFQDTSTLQYRLLGDLTRGWEPEDGRTLFVVGDGMQSLYGFRNANVGLFLEARQLPLGNIQMTPLDLNANFRSQAGIIHWANEVFASSFPQQDHINRGAVRYSPAVAVKPELSGPAVTIDGFHDFPDNRAEAEQVLKRIQQARAEDPQGSIAVLVRDRGQLKNLLPLLRNAGLSWTARDIEPIAQQMAVIDLLSLTKAMIDPTDRIAWLSILRAPWCGLDLKDLFHIANSKLPAAPLMPGNSFPLILQQLQHYQAIPELSDRAKERLTEVVPLLLKSWQQRLRKPLRVSVESLWRALAGDQISQNYGQYQSCLSLLNLIEQQEAGHSLPNWQLFRQAVNRLYAEPEPDADPTLEIMTIHKAKGLEFDTVILPGLNRKSAGGQSPLMLWREGISDQGQSQLVISPREPAAGENIYENAESGDAIFQYLKYENRHREHLENARVMYVGATRAIKRLHLLYTAKTSKSGVRVIKGSLLDAIWPWLQENQQHPNVTLHQAPEQQEQSEESLPSKTWLLRLAGLPQSTAAPQSAPAFSPGPTPEFFTGKASTPYTASPQKKDESEAQIAGTVLHRILRQITLDGIDHWQQLALDERLPYWRLLLENAGSSDIEAHLTRLQSAVQTLLQDSDNHWIFDHSHPHSACELEISYRDNDDGRVRKSVIDRTFVRPGSTDSDPQQTQGCRWVIDYKMSQPHKGEPLDHFLQRQTAHYRPQLEHYAQLLSGDTATTIKMGLYFPVIGRFHEVQPI